MDGFGDDGMGGFGGFGGLGIGNPGSYGGMESVGAPGFGGGYGGGYGAGDMGSYSISTDPSDIYSYSAGWEAQAARASTDPTDAYSNALADAAAKQARDFRTADAMNMNALANQAQVSAMSENLSTVSKAMGMFGLPMSTPLSFASSLASLQAKSTPMTSFSDALAAISANPSYSSAAAQAPGGIGDGAGFATAPSAGIQGGAGGQAPTSYNALSSRFSPSSQPEGAGYNIIPFQRYQLPDFGSLF